MSGAEKMLSEVFQAPSREQIQLLVGERVSRLCEFHGISTPWVSYDLRGRAAGQAIWPANRIRLNWALLESNLPAFLENVIPHELCHLWHRQLGVVDRPHGRFWQELMRRMGAEPSRCHDFKVEEGGRQQRQFQYQCQCSTHSLSARRHNRVLQGAATYQCRRCRSRLVHQS